MTVWRWLLYIVLVLLAAALSAWLYLRREPPGRGRLLLAGLRAASLAIILILILDPLLAARRGAGGRAPRILLDASASMALPAGPGDSASRWDAALAEVHRRRGSILLFGDRVRPAAAGSVPAVPPGDARSLVLPALQVAAEAGAERVVVITDGALEGASALPGWLSRLGLGVDWVVVGKPLGGLSLPEVGAPAWAVAGSEVALQVTVAAASPSPDSTRLLVRQDGRTLWDSVLAAPASGRTTRLQVPVRPAAPAEGGYVRLEVALQPGDALPDDDRRFVSLYISAEPAGVTLISLQPDQEPRFLLPVLARALGVPVRGYLHAGTGWVRVGGGSRAGEPAPEPEVQRAAARAELLVVQGAGPETPVWLEPVLRSGPPLLVLPGSPGGSLPVPLRIGNEMPGDWFLQAAVPPSPVAALLADVATADLPPLPALFPSAPPPGSWAPLLVTRGRSGEVRPLLLAGQAGGRRWAVALAEGYWRWAFQGGVGRSLYDRLWSAVGGWLLGDAAGEGEAVRPVGRVVARSEPSRWLTPGLRPDSLRLRVTAAGGASALDTVLRNPAGDTLQAPVLPPGAYRYQARAFAGERRLDGTGDLTVETWSPELARTPVRLAALAPADLVTSGAKPRGARRPLHTSPVPYVLVVLLLSAEWVLRRRWGLR